MNVKTIVAVVVAAGRSSRMGEFKPLLPFRGSTVAETVVSTLRSAGAESVVVVTGREAKRLEAVLGPGIEYVHNASYASTSMFVSASLGLAEARHRADRIFFTPADVPLFTRETLLRLLKSDARAVVPTHFGSPGHPVLLSSFVVPEILDHPEGTLREALAACGTEYVEVPDLGVLIDVDTPADYTLSRLLAGELPEGGAIPERIRRHMKATADFATTLGALLNARGNCGLNLPELELAASLHDIRRTEPHHALAGARTLAEAGQPRLAEIVRQHMLPDEAERMKISEVTVLYLADKMTEEDRVVSLEERFRSQRTKKLGSLQAVEQRFSVASALKNRMELLIGEKITPGLLRFGEM
ncbi:MAG: NTP transferase domain-containing protein [Synergistaceae bacterium]|jgi:CTP:molybdopterin cytidylyltransferase MocA|nr:NTP transferase domain-containing protein [Synergistaceae bacterium]